MAKGATTAARPPTPTPVVEAVPVPSAQTGEVMWEMAGQGCNTIFRVQRLGTLVEAAEA